MTFLPLELMVERTRRHGADSDTALFTELLYAGEFILKVTVAAFVAGIENDRENHRYRLVHSLIRADGIGEWSRGLDDVLVGTATQHLSGGLFSARRSFTERFGNIAWQREAVCLLHGVLEGISNEVQPLPNRVALRTWFQMFVELRNKTRGHGALTPAICARLVPQFKESIELLSSNNPIFPYPGPTFTEICRVNIG
jgi:hypothetical protein